jgi:hypothetical protein
MPETKTRTLMLVIPGLDPAGAYDEEDLFPLLSDWLRRHYGVPSWRPDPPLYVDEGGVKAYRAFFLEGKKVEAMLTLSVYFDPASPTQSAGLVTDAHWGNLRDVKPLLGELTALGRRLDLGSIIVPSQQAVQQRQFAAKGYEPHAVVIFSGGVPAEPTHYYRAFLAS